jgi:ribosomal protein S18 acetylase RimI-like enzyme
MSVQCLIRPAIAADLDAMVALLAELFAIESDFNSEPERQRRGLALLLEDARALLLVAECDGVVVGVCSMQQLISTAEGGPVGLVEDVVVAAAHRGKGMGRQMLAAMQEMAARRGISRLQLLADRDNKAALRFYEKSEWETTRLIGMRRTI